MVKETTIPQNNNDFSFSVVSLVTSDTPPLEKVMSVHSHKYSGKDMMRIRGQLRVAEERKHREVVLVGKRIGS